MAPGFSTVIVVAPCAVKPAGANATPLETTSASRMHRDHCARASRRVPCHHGQNRRPFFTFVSEGKPLWRLLVISKGSFVVVVVLHGTSSVTPSADAGFFNRQCSRQMGVAALAPWPEPVSPHGPREHVSTTDGSRRPATREPGQMILRLEDSGQPDPGLAI